ncbi:MAG TPA: C40 family peptidase [Streptosporangiaceae bacterium]|nr:C40 family peptidase [Streptosporangiaceae bacterium]
MIAFALVLSLVLTGLLSHSRSRLALDQVSHAHGTARAGHASNAISTMGISPLVGRIPGVGTAGPAMTLTAVTKPLPTAGHAALAAKKIRLLPADVLVVSQASLSAKALKRLGQLPGVVAAVPVDAGRIKVNGVFVNVLGVNPTTFRPFAARPTAGSTTLWDNIAAGGMAISYTMSRQDKLSLRKPVEAAGARTLKLPVAGFGTVGIGGVDAVVSSGVAKSLGLPVDNAVVISAPKARLDRLMKRIRQIAPAHSAVAALVTQVIAGDSTVTAAAAGDLVTAGQGPGLTSAQLTRFLSAAMSRIGLPYVWGGAGPTTFDCSGLVQWAMAQAGIVMPRVAADQARTGPLLPLSALQPGDLLFYHTDPTAPDYISHVAIYIGNGEMLQAPEPGLDVEIVRADFGAGFAGAIRVYPRVAAAAAGSPVG